MVSRPNWQPAYVRSVDVTRRVSCFTQIYTPFAYPFDEGQKGSASDRTDLSTSVYVSRHFEMPSRSPLKHFCEKPPDLLRRAVRHNRCTQAAVVKRWRRKLGTVGRFLRTADNSDPNVRHAVV